MDKAEIEEAYCDTFRGARVYITNKLVSMRAIEELSVCTDEIEKIKRVYKKRFGVDLITINDRCVEVK